MPKYFYTAKSFQGEERSGDINIKDEHQLARVLHKEGYVLISATLIDKTEKKSSLKAIEINIPFLSQVSLKEKIFFTRNLSVMISAGIPLTRALRTLADVTKNKKFKKTLFEIAEEITKGQSFSSVLVRYPDVFSELFCSLIKAGEESGTLEDVLKNLTNQMDRENELRSKLMGAMIYPSVIILAMLGIGIVMLAVVVPKLAETFEELAIELPMTTRVVIALGTFISEKWYLFLFIIIVLALFFGRATKTKRGKKIIDNFVLRIPIISPIIRKTNSAHMVRTLGSLINSGVPFVTALEITSRVLGNINFREAIIKATEKVKKGKKLSESLHPYEGLFPSVVIQMIEVGEETGETSDILQKLAVFFEEEVTNATKNMASVVEPVLMLLIGGAVGFFAISMVQPMYSMLGAIQ